jgi:hypothetical protein
MFEKEYRELVLADYDRKLAAGMLPPELMSPTPGGIKAETAKACERGYTTRDELLLRSFFNKRDTPAAYRIAIQNSPAELFKPLNNFLKDRSIQTSFKNVELLAWLIDYKQRPFHSDLRIDQRADDMGGPLEQGTRPAISASPVQVEPAAGRTIKRKKKIYVYLSLGLVMGLIGYLVISRNNHRPTGQEGCMIWNADHYQPVECRDKTMKTAVYPLDPLLVDNFKKIMRPDTLTPRSIGKVWYAKYHGRVEFFTWKGYYPLDTNRRLLPMSDHILEKYVYHVTN